MKELIKKLILLYLLCFIYGSYSLSQERKKIDRTNKTVVKKKRPSSSQKKSTVVKSSKRTKKTYLNISSQFARFDSYGGIKTFTVSSNSSWEIWLSTASWGKLTKNGNTLTLRVEENRSLNSRSDYFTVRAGNITRRVDIRQEGQTSLKKQAEIKNVSVENNTDVDGKKGLTVRVSFNIKGMKEKNAKVVAYFYDSDGRALNNNNAIYGTSGKPSQVSTSTNIKPGYDSSVYTDLKLKIPYDELHLYGTNQRQLRVDVVIWNYDNSVEEITRKENIVFTCIPDVSYLKIDGSVSNKTKYFNASGGAEYYSVTTNAYSYETWGVPSWCRIENKTSKGFTLVCERNNSRLSRSDFMKVKAAGKEIRIDIKQEAASGPTAKINRMWVDHNVYNGNQKGLKVHINLDVNGMKDRNVKFCVFFYKEDNKTKLINYYGNHISSSATSVANYDGCNWSDWWIFIPYTTIFGAYNSDGRYSLDVEIQDINGNLLTREENYSFYRN